MSANAPLHPAWGKALGLKAVTPAVENDRATASDDGWQPVSAINARPGAPVAIKKKLGPHLWISTTVRPGDPRYPSAQQP
ncbi:MAG: hypothetical protein ACOY5H_11595 [Pseudomonadota bacterium]